MPDLFRVNGRGFFLDARRAVAGVVDPGFAWRGFVAAAVSARGYRFGARRTRRSRPTVAKLTQFFDYLIERRLAEALNCLDDRNFEMELLVRRPFHAAFGGGKLIDHLQQTIRGNQFRVRGKRLLHVRIDVLLERVRLGFEHEQIAQVCDQVRHEPHHVLAAFTLLMQQIDRLRRFGPQDVSH